jgi:hypothetical protein
LELTRYSDLNPVWLDCLAVLGQLGKQESRARVAYRGFVESGIDGADEREPLAAAANG